MRLKHLAIIFLAQTIRYLQVGSARFASPLSVDDFIKKSSFTYYTKDALAKEAEKINTFSPKRGINCPWEVCYDTF